MPSVNADGTAHERNADDPTHTVQATAYKQMPRAFIVDGKLSSSGKILRVNDGAEPMGTVVASQSAMRDTRARLSQGRVVAMTPRCLARFQSFPDWYVLPDKNALSCRIIGNAVPPLMYAAVARSFCQDIP